MNETEIIQHPQIDGLRIFFDTVDNRQVFSFLCAEIIFVVGIQGKDDAFP